MQKLRLCFLAALLFLISSPTMLKAHECGPKTLAVNVGQSKNWSIKNDEPQFVSTYTIKSMGDTSIVRISPVQPFSGNGDGDYTFTGKKAGQTTFVIEWKAVFMGVVVGRDDCEVTVTVSAPQQPDIDAKPASVSFGKVRFGQSIKKTFQVFNTGNTILSVSDISSDNTDFFAGPGSFTLSSGDSQLIEVVFDAAKVGFASGNLTIVSNDPDEPEVLIGVSGEAAEPDIDVGPLPLPGPPTVVVGKMSKSNFRVSNIGGFDLNLMSITSSNPAFSVKFQSPVPTFPATLPPPPAPPDNFADFDIFFAPGNAGPDSTTLTIISDDPDEAELVFNVKSTGLPKQPDIDADSSDSFIGVIALGESSTRTFVIANRGTANLNVQNISTDNSAFAVTLTTLTVAPGDSEGVNIVFAPTKAGRDSTTMTIVSNDPDEGEFLVKVFGQGGVPDIEADTTLVFADTLFVGGCDTMLFRVSNEGSVTLAFNNVVSSNPEFSVTNSFPTEIRVDGTEDDFLDLQVVFKPTGLGKRMGTLTLVSNDPDEPEFSVNVSGTTHAPDIDALTSFAVPDTIPFPGLLTKTEFLIVSNVGTAQLTINSIDSDGEAFSIVTPLPKTIPPGAQFAFDVLFSPTKPGKVEEEFLIKSNDPDEALFFVKIRGFSEALPQIDFSTVSVAETIPVNSTKTIPLVILNTAGENAAALKWNADSSDPNNGNEPLFLELLPPMSGAIAAGDSAVLTVQLHGLMVADTTYMANIEINTNIPGEDSMLVIPVTLMVQDSNVTSIGLSDFLPTAYSLGENYPNPFNPSTTIEYHVPVGGEVRLLIYNMLGQRVRTLVDGQKQGGAYKVTWDGRNDSGRTVAGGVYLYYFTAGDFKNVRRMILLK